MTPLKRRCLDAMGVPVWRLRGRGSGISRDSEPPARGSGFSRDSEPPARGSGFSRDSEPQQSRLKPLPHAPATSPLEPQSAATLDWDALTAAVRACTRCALHATRTQAVVGVGSANAALMVVGEAPGAEEDRRGEPFVGPAGQLLNAMLRSIGLERENVYIANILKCRPPGNRDPKPDEAATCTPYLDRQIALVAPRAILAVGRIAGQWLLQSELPIGRLRGQVLRYGDSRVPLVVTYHPAYLLRTPLAKAKSWQDLCLIRDVIATRQ